MIGICRPRWVISATFEGGGALSIRHPSRLANRKGAVLTPKTTLTPQAGIGPDGRHIEYELDVPMKRILIPADKLNARVHALGEEITEMYRGTVPLLVSILKGGVVFLTDLMRAVRIPHHIDFLQLSSYSGGKKTTGTVRLLSDLGTNIAGRDVIIVEDIVDTGLTLTYLLKQLEIRQPNTLRVCALLNKVEARQVEVPIDFVGFEIPNEFVVGYGLDFDEKYRNLPYIGVLDAP